MLCRSEPVRRNTSRDSPNLTGSRVRGPLRARLELGSAGPVRCPVSPVSLHHSTCNIVNVFPDVEWQLENVLLANKPVKAVTMNTPPAPPAAHRRRRWSAAGGQLA